MLGCMVVLFLVVTMVLLGGGGMVFMVKTEERCWVYHSDVVTLHSDLLVVFT